MIEAKWYLDQLQERDAQGLLRRLRSNPQMVNFASNDYLDLARHPALAEACAQGALKHGTGSTGSRLLTGSPTIFAETEQKLALWKGSQAALLFNNGYAANLGLVSAFCDSETHVFFDRLNHASLYDGARLSGARLHRFKHNDPQDLERLLQTNPGKGWVFTESVFSMDGDLAPLAQYASLAQKYRVGLAVDEAHADGVFGPGGRGLVHELGLMDQVDLVMGTFGKALGCAGACVWGSQVLVDWLVNHARSFIYSTANSPAVVAAVSRAVDLLDQEPWRREDLLRLSGLLRQRLQAEGFDILQSQSQIIPIVLGDNASAISASEFLATHGFWVFPIRQPTVPAGTARLRVNVNASHSEAQLIAFVDCLCAWRNS
jgi:8-amino-7-oxononanoate synthase